MAIPAIVSDSRYIKRELAKLQAKLEMLDNPDVQAIYARVSAFAEITLYPNKGSSNMDVYVRESYRMYKGDDIGSFGPDFANCCTADEYIYQTESSYMVGELRVVHSIYAACPIPADDLEILRGIGKIVETTQTYQTLVCGV